MALHWWHYGEKETAYNARPGRGISASLVWGGGDVAYGITYHHNPKWSLTVAQGDANDLVLSVSFQLAHWLVRR